MSAIVPTDAEIIDEQAGEIELLQETLRALCESLAVFSEGGDRCVDIPNRGKFWRNYDAAMKLL